MLDRTSVTQALQTGGTREIAASILGVSVRTLARAMSAYGLTSGPTRNTGATARMMEWLRGHGGVVDIPELALVLYGTDDRAARQRVRRLLQAREK